MIVASIISTRVDIGLVQVLLPRHEMSFVLGLQVLLSWLPWFPKLSGTVVVPHTGCLLCPPPKKGVLE